jgi:hypothetical protein
MYRRFFIATACAALMLGATAPAPYAQDTQLSASELEQLLTGNTAEGVWDGIPYKSYFGPSGVAIYDPQNGDALTGKWRINPETGQYESFWDAVGWTAYDVIRTNEGYAWGKDGRTYPFAMIDGRNVSE